MFVVEAEVVKSGRRKRRSWTLEEKRRIVDESLEDGAWHCHGVCGLRSPRQAGSQVNGDCHEFCVWSHNSADGGRLWQLGFTHEAQRGLVLE